MTSKYDEPWSDEELRVCVEIYADVVRRGGTKRELSKDLFIARGEKGTPGRNRTAVLYRMQNISSILEDHNLDYVMGWAPKKNVGSGMVPRIEAIMRDADLL